MTNIKMSGKRITAFLLCFSVLLSFATFAPFFSSDAYEDRYTDNIYDEPVFDDTTELYTIVDETVVINFAIEKLSQMIESETGSLITFDFVKIDNISAIVFPLTVIERISMANLGIEIIMQHGLISLNRQVLASLSAQGTGTTVTIYFHEMERSALSETQQHVLSTYDLVYFVQILVGTYNVTSFGGTMTVMVPYSGETPVGVWRLFGDGRLEDVPSVHDRTRMTVSFMLNRLSLFVVGVDHHAAQPQPMPPILALPPEIIPPDPIDIPMLSNPFADVSSSDWFYDDVLFVFSRGIMGEVGNQPDTIEQNNLIFSPNTSLTRSMIVTILHRLEGAPLSPAINPFIDVADDAWYSGAVVWAADAGIITGVGDGRFAPSANITRQDLAVLFVRYARYSSTTLLPMSVYIPFADQSSISAYAVTAVRQTVEAGIMGGTTGNRFAPHDTATRAQAAAMIHRLVTLR